MAWPDREDQLRRLLPLLTGTGGSVLDLGCGDGVLLGLLKDAGEKGEGVEKDSGKVKAGRARGLDIRQGDVLGFIKRAGAGRYGAVVASHILEHLPPARVPEAFSGCARALKPGGRLLVLTPNPRNIGVMTQTFWGDLEHVRPYALSLLVRLAEQAGLRIVRAGDDPYTRQRGLVHRPLNFLRRLLVGDYWPGSDLLLIAEKP